MFDSSPPHSRRPPSARNHLAPRTALFVGALVGTLVAAPAGQSAAQGNPSCPAPTLTECQSEAYYQTTCGADEIDRRDAGTGRCGPLLQAAMPAALAAVTGPSRTTFLPVDASRGGARTATSVKVGGPRPLDVSGNTSTYAGFLQRAAERIRETGRRLSGPFDSNGVEIASCDEYVYERYYDYSIFEEQAARHVDDARAVYDLAFAPGAFAANALAGKPAVRSRSGGTTHTIEWPQHLPKNAYYTFDQKMPLGEEAAVLDADLAARLRAGTLTPVHDPAWHASMSRALASFSDEVLYGMEAEQTRFVQLLELRERMYREWNRSFGAFGYRVAKCNRELVHFELPGYKDPNRFINPNPGDLWVRLVPWSAVQLDGVARMVGRALDTHLGLGGAVAEITAIEIPSLPWLGEDLPPTFEGRGLAPATAARETAFKSSMCSNLEGAADRLKASGRHVGAQLRMIDQQIEAELFKARDNGCLEQGPTPCDWSPRLFANEAADHFTAARERDHRRCLRYTADQLGPGSTIRNASSAGISAHDNMAASTELAETFFRDLQVKASALDFPADPQTGRPMFGTMALDLADLGNRQFKIAYGYEVGWRMKNLDTFSVRMCAAEIDAKANLRATGTVFGNTQQVVDAEHWVRSFDDTRNGGSVKGVHYQAHLSVLGIDVYGKKGQHASFSTQIGAGPIDWALTPVRFTRRQTLIEARQTFPIGPIPVTLAAGLGGQIGFDMRMSANIQRNCPNPTQDGAKQLPGDTLGIFAQAQAKPWASLDAFASAAVDLLVASAGVRIDLSILRLEVPLSLELGLGFLDPSQPTALLAWAKPHLTLALRTLDGRVSVFINTLFGKVLDETVFSWQGPRVEKVLFDESWQMKLLEARLALSASGF